MEGLIDHTEPRYSSELGRRVVSMNGDHDNMTTESSARPTEAECWKSFWEQVAIMWLELPPEIQREYAERFPRTPTAAPSRS